MFNYQRLISLETWELIVFFPLPPLLLGVFALQDPDHAVHLRLKTPEKTHLRPIGSHPAIGKDWKYANIGILENQLDIGKSTIGNIGKYGRKRLEICHR